MSTLEITGILVDPFTKTITEITLNKDKDKSLLPALYNNIGCKRVEKVELEHELRNDLVVDEEGLFEPNQKFKKKKKLAPYTIAAGKGIILGFNKNGDWLSRRLTIEDVEKDVVWFATPRESSLYYSTHIEPLFE